MVGPINVFMQIFGGLLASTAGPKFVRSDDGMATDTAADVTAVTAAAKKAMDTRSEVQVLRAAIDKLILVNRALWEIIAASQGLTEEYLLNKVNEIDLRDGVLDGKMREPIRKCTSCGKVLQLGHAKCVYCGTKNEGADPFQSINTDSRNDMAQGLT
jgi:hypothetical protein